MDGTLKDQFWFEVLVRSELIFLIQFILTAVIKLEKNQRLYKHVMTYKQKPITFLIMWYINNAEIITDNPEITTTAEIAIPVNTSQVLWLWKHKQTSKLSVPFQQIGDIASEWLQGGVGLCCPHSRNLADQHVVKHVFKIAWHDN